MKKICGSRIAFLLGFVAMIVITAVSLYYNLYCNEAGRWVIFQDFYFKMILECVVIWFVSCIITCAARNRFLYFAGIAFIIAIVSYLHQILIPVLAIIIYSFTIFLVGKCTLKLIINRKSGRYIMEDKGVWLLVGCCVEIVMTAILSAANRGEIQHIRFCWLVLAGIAFLLELSDADSRRKPAVFFSSLRKTKRKPDIYNSFLVSGIIMSFCIQIARANISLDFDSLWYCLHPEYVLANSAKGIFEDLGLLASVYTYPKGFEILCLPFSDFSSYGYMLAFNIMLAALLVWAVDEINRLNNISKNYRRLCMLLITAIPGIMNMSITGKTDIITVLFQLLMVRFYLLFQREKATGYLMSCLGCYFFSLCLKPTAIIFSTGLLGALILCFLANVFIYHNRNEWKWTGILIPVLSGLTWLVIMLRTWLITGLPLTTVASGIMQKLGFTVKYPYSMAGQDLTRYSMAFNRYFSLEGLKNTVSRIFHALFLPTTEEMDHFCTAWGTLIVAILLILTLFVMIFQLKSFKAKARENILYFIWWVIFLAISGLSLASLIILPRPDGNYFMLLYAITPVAFFMFAQFSDGVYKKIGILMLPVIAGAFIHMCAINWAWSHGFTEIKPENCGYYAHKTIYNEKLEKKMGDIYDKIKKTGVRMLVIGDNVSLNRFPAVVESIWSINFAGNPGVFESRESFAAYLKETEKDYIYSSLKNLNEDTVMYGLIRELISDGTIKNIIFENNKLLFELTDLDDLPPEKIQENMNLFNTVMG